MKKTLLHLLIFITYTFGIQAQTVQDTPTKHTFACTDYTGDWSALFQMMENYCGNIPQKTAMTCGF